MKYETSAGAVIYRVDPQTKECVYLIMRSTLGYWDFPKGKLETNETSEQAAVREVKEETGLAIIVDEGFKQSISYFFKDRNGDMVSKTVIYFTAPTIESDVTVSPEHMDYKWLSFDEARATLTFHNARQLLDLANEYVIHNKNLHHQHHNIR
jgi:8-oxo-dGTP pyrophosphatase MutT (NUDIX family)